MHYCVVSERKLFIHFIADIWLKKLPSVCTFLQIIVTIFVTISIVTKFKLFLVFVMFSSRIYDIRNA